MLIDARVDAKPAAEAEDLATLVADIDAARRRLASF
jgi:hypothetical protein